MNHQDALICRLDGQHLLKTADAPDALSVAGDLCGVQAQFLRNAVHALRIRSGVVGLDGLVKTWTLRGAVHLIPEADLPLFLPRMPVDDVCRSAWYRWQADRGMANSPEIELRFARLALEAISSGIDDRDGIRLHLRDCGMTDEMERRLFHPWGGLLRELADIGLIAFRVQMADDVRPDEAKRYRLLTPFTPLNEADAKREILRRYVTHYGPATLRDAAYFLRWTQADVKRLLPQLPVERVALDGRDAFFIPAELADADMPDVLLLSGFDPLMLGYRKEDHPFLPPEHLRGVFNLAGIVHPAILLRGRVVGRWKEASGKAEFTAFEPIRQTDKIRVEAELARLYPLKKVTWT